MKQRSFELKYQQSWITLEQLLLALERREKPDDICELPTLYRQVCHHLSLAKERHYSSHLVAKLNALVLRGHQQLYKRETHFRRAISRFISYTFPNQFRQQINYFWLANVLFYLPTLIVFALIQWQGDMVYYFLGYEQVTTMESMYDPSNEHFGQDREAKSDVMMFGYYIQNNISIGLQTFATGLIFAIGPIFYLVFNGIMFGAVSSHMLNINYTETFFPFIIGHCAFELTAITIAGQAGLMIGHSLIKPGNLTRKDALRDAALKALDLVYGIIIMLLIAAYIEAFWSSNSALPSEIKYSVGAVLWLVVIAYLAFAGKATRTKAGQ